MQTIFSRIFLKFLFSLVLFLILFPHFVLTNTHIFYELSRERNLVTNFSLKSRGWCTNPKCNSIITGGDVHILAASRCLLLAHQIFCIKTGKPLKEATNWGHPGYCRPQQKVNTHTVPEHSHAITVALSRFETTRAQICGKIKHLKVFFKSGITYITYFPAYSFSCPHFRKGYFGYLISQQ